MIEIRALNKADLSDYLKTEDFNSGAFIPISSHRAASHFKNPRATEHDIIMLLAYSQEVLVGYLGVLPDWIFEADGTQHACGWLSCMWIDPTFRGRGISKKLVRRALDHWDQKILVTEFTAAAKGLYDKVGAFKDLQTLRGIRLYRRLDLAKFLPPKKSFYQKNKGILARVDRLANLFLDFRFRFDKPSLPNSTISYFESLGPNESRFINSKNSESLFFRGDKELSWILNNPWITSDPKAFDEAARYHFSAAEKKFHFTGLTIGEEQNINALLIFAIRGSNMKIPYCYFNDGMEDEIIRTICVHLKKWKISTLTTFHPMLVDRLQNGKTGSLFKKSVQRNFIISKTLEKFNHQTSYLIQDGDGDCAFT